MTIEDIIESIRKGKIRITDHADEEAHNDGLTFDEIFMSALNGVIIESYPDDSPYPSCLIYGRNFRNEPIHSVWSCNKATGACALITVYRPDPKRWVEWKRRKK
ncbi:MAG: DUF4258 domain-containing protein [Deltaproteobacteria bacterium]|nr:DUF4258 domain-containing protein [Deltaproteobacteria bacterium]